MADRTEYFAKYYQRNKKTMDKRTNKWNKNNKDRKKVYNKKYRDNLLKKSE